MTGVYSSDMERFSEAAFKLAKNPIGIIALFIVLIYGFAALVVGVSGDTLTAEQKWPMIWFLVLSPFVVLATFYRLVTKHHTRLYAPSDFKDEQHFIRLQNPAIEETLKGYTEEVRRQLEDAKATIAELEKRGEKKTEEMTRIREAYSRLSRSYEGLKYASDNNVRPELITIVNSATSSNALAESTATVSPIVKSDLYKLLETASDPSWYPVDQ